jgi:hypothetical protein
MTCSLSYPQTSGSKNNHIRVNDIDDKGGMVTKMKDSLTSFDFSQRNSLVPKVVTKEVHHLRPLSPSGNQKGSSIGSTVEKSLSRDDSNLQASNLYKRNTIENSCHGSSPTVATKRVKVGHDNVPIIRNVIEDSDQDYDASSSLGKRRGRVRMYL